VETDSRSTRGFLSGAVGRTALGIIWEGAEAVSNGITGIQRLVHSNFIPRAVLETQIYKAVQQARAPQIVAWTGGYKAIHHSGAFKAVAPDHAAVKASHGAITAKVAMPSDDVGKSVRDERLARVCDTKSTRAIVVNSGGR